MVFFPFYALNVIDLMFFRQFEEFDVFDYSVAFGEPVGDEGIAHLAEMIEAYGIEPYAEYPFTITRGWREHTVMVRALEADSQLQRFEDVRGGIIEIPSSGLLLSRYLAEDLDVAPGDTLTVSSPALGGRKYTLPVRGVINQYLGSGVYMSREQMDRLGGRGLYTGALIGSGEDIKVTLGRVGNVASIYSTQDLIRVFNDFMGLIIVSYSMLVLIGGILGFTILFNTTSVAIEERAREFSSMRVLGYTQKEIFQTLVRENVLATIAGIILGIPMARSTVGLLASMVQSEMFYLPAVASPISYGIAGILVAVFTVLVMVAIRARVYGLNLLEALSSRLT